MDFRRLTSELTGMGGTEFCVNGLTPKLTKRTACCLLNDATTENTLLAFVPITLQPIELSVIKIQLI